MRNCPYSVNVLDQLVGIRTSTGYVTTNEFVDNYKLKALALLDSPVAPNFCELLRLLHYVLDEDIWVDEPVRIQNRIASKYYRTIFKFDFSMHPEVHSTVVNLHRLVLRFLDERNLLKHFEDAALTYDTRFTPWQRRKYFKK